MAAEAQTVTGRDYGLGFETLESEISLDSLPVEGSIPDWLAGTLIRNGPAKYEVGERRFRHWFDGLAMLHRFSFAGGEVSYANRFLRTNAYREAEQGRISYREFATDPCRSIFKRAATMFRPNLTDNCNVNLARLGDEYIAMTETPLPVAFDPETLDALGVAYEVAGPPRHRPSSPRPRDATSWSPTSPTSGRAPSTGSTPSATAPTSGGSGRTGSRSPPTCTASR